MVDQHDRPRARRKLKSEKRKSGQFLVRTSDRNCQGKITFFVTALDCVTNHAWRGFRAISESLLKQKADSFWSAPKINLFRVKLRFCNNHPRGKKRTVFRRTPVKKYGCLNRLSRNFCGDRTLIILPAPPFQIFAGGKKRTVFGPHPCPKKCSNSWDFWGYVRSSEVMPAPRNGMLHSIKCCAESKRLQKLHR